MDPVGEIGVSVVDLLVIAKEPLPGRAKTRLIPPCSPGEAAGLAEAALADTLEAAAATPARRHLLVLDGKPGSWVPAGFDVVTQVEGDLAARLAGAFSHTDGPALLIGMDTPQLQPALLDPCMQALAGGAQALLGMAEDGGYWAIGLARPDPRVFGGIAMSRGDTGHRQAERLAELGLTVSELPRLRDVDTFADALEVAALVPDSRFGRAVAALEHPAAA